MRRLSPHQAPVLAPVGAGLGLRRSLVQPLLTASDAQRPAFLELAPENWMHVGGRYARQLREIGEQYPLVAHGLSLSLGSTDPLDETFLTELRTFLDQHQVHCFSEHLSYCSDQGHLYDLMPIPFTEAAIEHVAARIRRAQDILERRIGIENVSYYAAPASDMSESAFLRAVLDQADCDLMLDVNNVYVNSINHGYDPQAFIDTLAGYPVCYLHVAGHFDEAEDLKVDTHGTAVIDPVWALLKHAYQHFGPAPTLLERDFNLPPLPELLEEVAQIRRLQAACAGAV